MSEKRENKPVRLALVAYRARVQLGFGFCAAGLGVALTYVVVVAMVGLAGGAVASAVKEHEAIWQFVSLGVESLTALLLLAAVVLLHRVPFGPRSRWATTFLLAMLGADISFLVLRAVAEHSPMVRYAALLGFAIGWVELWMMAVLAAEAAEAAGRPDIVHQTEVLGSWIVGGGFIWLISAIWSFDVKQLDEATEPAVPDAFGALVGLVGIVLHLVVIARTAVCCFGLAMEYGEDESEGEPTAGG